MKKIILVLDNIRSAYNVGSIFRTSDAVSVEKIVLCGITPYPSPAKISTKFLAGKPDSRLPYVRERATRQIAKTALGAEKLVNFEYQKSVINAVKKLKKLGYKIYTLEKINRNKSYKMLSHLIGSGDVSAINIFKFKPRLPCALIVGHEVDGVNTEILIRADAILEIPMRGKKESLNVSVATGIALYQLLIH